MKLHREGKTILIWSAIGVLIISVLFFSFLSPLIAGLLSLYFILLFGFEVWFFRDPERGIEAKPNEVIAPVDGKVVVLEKVFEKEFLKKECLQLSIFMSPLNVHVCRYPVSGKVEYVKYHPGKYLVAWHPKSSELNERTTTVVQTANNSQVLFRQIAGALARRIVQYSKPGDQAKASDEYGFIKFGSRLDVFLPLDTEILVQKGDLTRGGEQIIARLK